MATRPEPSARGAEAEVLSPALLTSARGPQASLSSWKEPGSFRPEAPRSQAEYAGADRRPKGARHLPAQQLLHLGFLLWEMGLRSVTRELKKSRRSEGWRGGGGCCQEAVPTLFLPLSRGDSPPPLTHRTPLKPPRPDPPQHRSCRSQGHPDSRFSRPVLFLPFFFFLSGYTLCMWKFPARD